MCGIAGKLFLDLQTPVDPELIERMTDTMAHRGPNGAGKYVSGPIGLGHRRLSIIDLRPSGAQPMCNEDKTVWIVFNGEIYNYHELREELLLKGHTFSSTTDTEVIVHLYEDCGEQCLSRLRGMFAFAIWDERKKTLFLARDRVGIKPLYFTSDGNAFLFGSEIKAILTDPKVPREVNLRAIDRFLTYYFLPGRETLFKGIYKLEPGHSLTIQNGRLVDRQYWDLDFQAQNQRLTEVEAVEALQTLLSETIKDHMVSDVPVGVLLSGGVDSTGVLRYASMHSKAPLNTFTVGFSGAAFADERPYATLAAQRFCTVHHEISFSAREFRDFLPKYVWHMEEPVCEPPAVSLYYVSQLARKSSVPVLLSGEGGDEAFAGYPKYRNLMVLERLKAAMGPARSSLAVALKLVEIATRKANSHYRTCIGLPLSDYYYSLTATPQTPFNRYKSLLYNSVLAESMKNQDSAEPSRRFFSAAAGQPPLNQMLYVDTKTWLPDDLLIKADRMSMAASVELRVPLLDHRVLEFAASLPPSLKVRGATCKRILRMALADAVPSGILNRKKAGFPLPFHDWLRADLREYVNDTLLSANTSLDAYFRKPELRSLLEKQQEISSATPAGAAPQHALDYSREVFGLLVLELWHKAFGI